MNFSMKMTTVDIYFDDLKKSKRKEVLDVIGSNKNYGALPIVSISADTDKKAHDLYCKLHKCLKIALTAPVQPNGDDLPIHANHIIVNLARSIESGETWYDASVDIWCGYFLELHGKEEKQ